MATTYRQPLTRFDEIEVGDTLTFSAEFILILREEYDQTTNAYVKREKQWPVSARAYPTGKVLERIGDAWKIEGYKRPLITRENFWALRKAPGRGKTGDRRFAADDTVVECQVCGGTWIGNSGRLPHHGYLRPGWGEQTQSCAGALETAYAVIVDPKGRIGFVGRDVLPAIIAAHERTIAFKSDFLASVRAGDVPLRSEFATSRVSAQRPADHPSRNPVEPGDARYPRRQSAIADETIGQIRLYEMEVARLKSRYDAWPNASAGVDRTAYRTVTK